MYNPEFEDFFTYLKDACKALGGQKVTDEHKRFWKAVMEKFSFADAIAAVNRWMETNEFAPKPASLANVIREVQAERGEQKAREVQRASMPVYTPEQKKANAEMGRKYLAGIDWLKRNKPPETFHINRLLGKLLTDPSSVNLAQRHHLREVHAIDEAGNPTGKYTPAYEDWYESQGKRAMERSLGIEDDYYADAY